MLDILAARKDPNGLIGHVLINGHPQPSNFRLMSGYVVQDDVVMGTLSIRENLRFSADLRLPPGYSGAEKAAMVEKVLQELSLGKLYYKTFSKTKMKKVNVKTINESKCKAKSRYKIKSIIARAGFT